MFGLAEREVDQRLARVRRDAGKERSQPFERIRLQTRKLRIQRCRKKNVSEAESYATAVAMPWRWRIISGGGLLLALALLALVLAHWGWRWFGPAPVNIPPTVIEGEFTRRIAEAHLFGAAAHSVESSEPAAPGELRLLGVFAQRDGQG